MWPVRVNLYLCSIRMRPCLYVPHTLAPTPSFYMLLLSNWCAKCLFTFYQDYFLFPGCLALEALIRQHLSEKMLFAVFN